VGKQRSWVPKPPTDPSAATPAEPAESAATTPAVPAVVADAVPSQEVESAVADPDDTPLVPADLARRFGALVVDWILCTLISGLFASPTQTWWAPSLVLIVEYAFFLGLFTQTPGMFITGIRCVSVSTGGRIGIARAAMRGFLLAILVPALVMDAQRRGWHDKVAGSMMIPARRAA
jgi:RDD family